MRAPREGNASTHSEIKTSSGERGGWVVGGGKIDLSSQGKVKKNYGKARAREVQRPAHPYDAKGDILARGEPWAAIPPASHLPALFSTFSLDAAEAHLVKKFDPPSVEESNLSPIKPYVRRPVQPRPSVFENGRRDDADNSDVDMGGKGWRRSNVGRSHLISTTTPACRARRCSSFQHRGRMRGLFIVPAHLRSLAVRGGDYERRYGFVSHRYSGRVVPRSLAFAYANSLYVRPGRLTSTISRPKCTSSATRLEITRRGGAGGSRRVILTESRFRGRTRFGEGKSSGELVFGAALKKEERRTEKLTRTAFSIQTLVPAEQVQPHTLIAAVITDGVDFTGVRFSFRAVTHIYFDSPDNILSEYINPGGAWIGGPTCTTCIVGNRFAVQPGNSVLYALANNGPSEPAFIRVGFVSAGAPGALSEAVFTTANGWTLAQVSS
ncbi:hypothetical protein B0H16DRAFT_1478705 [Mycena metata]|uniref:Uncharacterized protein n=1 Tax=Mycena metata TaxID=1033252 RepID=A0AAD7H6V1_9AGAR|nr:hypothetical protein B0H16DRAFT_1478705 [Mycena metata]